jgi:5,6-dimethylbenzimidazole synthase
MSTEFTPSGISSLYRVIAERRDARHFLNDPVDEAILMRVLTAAHQAPSVGLMQPWRFIRVKNPALRLKIYGLVDEERLLTSAG